MCFNRPSGEFTHVFKGLLGPQKEENGKQLQWSPWRRGGFRGILGSKIHHEAEILG